MDEYLKGNRYKVIRSVQKTGGCLHIVADRVSYQKRIHKLLPLDAYRHELHIYQELSHPSFPALADAWEDSSGGHLILEFFEGPTLEEYLKQGGNMPESEILQMTADICEAVLCLHTLRPTVIHMDLKPSNIVLRPGKQAGILDLGAARQLWVDEAGNTPVFGTAGYASPEQIGGESPDERSDVYSLGRTMFRMMKGYRNRSRNRYRYSAGLKRAVRRASAPDPSCRYGNLTEMLSEIRRVNAEQTQRSGWKMLALGAAVFCALAAAFAAGAVQELSAGPGLAGQSPHLLRSLCASVTELCIKTDRYRSFHALVSGGTVPEGREMEFADLISEIEEDILQRAGQIREAARSSEAEGGTGPPEEREVFACLSDLHGLCHLYLIHADILGGGKHQITGSGAITLENNGGCHIRINLHVRLLAETGLELISECCPKEDPFVQSEKRYFQECSAFEIYQE